MSVYRVATPAVPNTADASGGSSVVHVGWASSARGARGLKAELAESSGCKASEIVVEEVETRKGKSGLIEYLNAFHTQVPGGYEPPGYSTPAPAKKSRKKKVKAKVKPAAKKK